MAVRTVSAVAVLLGIASLASANSTNLEGKYRLFVRQGTCPQTITHTKVLERNGLYMMPHKMITQEGAACTGESNFVVITWEMLEKANMEVANAIKADSDMAPLFNALDAQNASPLIGLEQNDRVCGATKITKNTLFVFVKEEVKIEIPGLITLFPGARYMVAFEENSPVPCTYFSKIDNRAIGEALPSQSPAHSSDAQLHTDDSIPHVHGTHSGENAHEEHGGKDHTAKHDGMHNAHDEMDVYPEGSSEPVESPEEDGGSTCFPADASVTMEDGSVKRMDAVVIGDRVQVSAGEFSDVFMFTHRDAEVSAKFVTIETAAGNKLQLTPGHYMYVNGELAAANTVNEGDVVELSNGEASVVNKVRTVAKKGIFNPQTVHGDIIVNGVRTSTYTQAVAPNAAHSLLAPVRALLRVAGFTNSAKEVSVC